MSLRPGDLVVQQKVMFDAALVERTGVVIGVRYDRKGAHIGCERRVDVLMTPHSDFQNVIDTLCDCELFNAQELP